MACTLKLHFSLDGSDAIYLDAHLVACLEKLRRPYRAPDSSWSPGKDYVSRLKRHRSTKMRNLIVNIEHQVLVFEFCRLSPLTKQRMPIVWGSPISSAVMIQGPIGA